VDIPTRSTGDRKYVAQWNKNDYTVTWVNYDNSLLGINKVSYETVPSYDGNEPTRASDSQYTSTFT
jgi:hypothetical protein